MTEPRHSRQVRLVEVGEVGQERLARATAVLRSDGDAGVVAARYAAAAGFGTVSVRSEEAVEAAHALDRRVRVALDRSPSVWEPPGWLGVRDPAARAVAAGAHEALTAVRTALGGATEGEAPVRTHEERPP